MQLADGFIVARFDQFSHHSSLSLVALRFEPINVLGNFAYGAWSNTTI
ncbi:MAG TPA: hypothetical protein VIG57_06765 [Candidatus Entotheonella sp.]|jgi:hypothetical protein